MSAPGRASALRCAAGRRAGRKDPRARLLRRQRGARLGGRSRVFGAVEHSLSICDQRVIDGALARARARDLGVIAERPVANAPWRFAQRPAGDYAEEYWWRWRTMDLDPRGLDWQELALRFTAFTPGVHSCIVGTRDPAHLRRNVELVARGPLPDDQVAAIRAAFRAHDPGWWRGEA